MIRGRPASLIRRNIFKMSAGTASLLRSARIHRKTTKGPCTLCQLQHARLSTRWTELC